MCWDLIGMSIRQIRSGVRMIANACGFEIQRLSKSSQHHVKLDLRSMNIRTVIDVGANMGQFASYRRAILPNARVICFEPLLVLSDN